MALTSAGLVTPRYPEILESVQTLLRQKCSASLTFDDDGILGQTTQAWSEREVLLYELLEIVHSARNINQAYGIQLDYLGLLKNTDRQPAAYTQGYQIFTGDLGTTIPANTRVRNTSTSLEYVTATGYQVSNLSLVGASVAVGTVADSTTYTLNVGSTSYTYTSGVSATSAAILAGIKAEIDADVTAEVQATIEGSVIVLDSYNYNPVALTYTTNLSLPKGSVLAYVYADETGPQESAIGEVTKLVTPILGIDSTTNPFSYQIGSDREGEEEYRARLLGPSATTGNATIPAIRAAVSAVTGVSYASVEHNNTDVDTAELPSKTFRVVVQGGTDADIAEAIFTATGAPTATYGTTTEVVIDDGQPHEINFSRPTGVFFAVRVSYETYGEESLSADVGLTIRQSIVAAVNTLGIGVDLIPQRLYEHVYKNTTGVGKVIVEIEAIPFSGSTPTGAWTEETASIAATEFAQSALVDVIVQEVTP